VDSQGNAYVVGYTSDTEFPLVNAAQAELGGNYDAFVAKLSADGSRLLYATFLGGRDLELGTGLALDPAGNAYVSGLTTSTNFPVTDRAVQRRLGGSYDAFVVKLDPNGQRVFATYLGGTRFESGPSLALDADRNIYVTGTTLSTNFPSALNPRWLGKAEAKRDGKKAYVAKLSADGTAVQYLSLLGGSDDDWGAAISVDRTGNAVVFGLTDSTDFPTTPNCWQPRKSGPDARTDVDQAWDHFVAKLNPTGTALIYATYLGGSSAENLREKIYVNGFYWTEFWSRRPIPSGNRRPGPGQRGQCLGGRSDLFG